MRDFDAALCVIGEAGDLDSPDKLAEAVRTLGMVAKATSAEIALLVSGFDDDPRELWDIPEVRHFVCRFAAALDVSVIRRLDHLSGILIGVCCGVLKPIGRDPVTGATTFEQVRPGLLR